MRIDDFEGKGAVARDDGGQIGDPVHDCDGVEEGCWGMSAYGIPGIIGRLTEGPQDDLRCHRSRHIPCRIWQLFGHMCDRIWGSDGEGAIQHPRQERDPVTPPSCVVLTEVAPYGGVASMDLRHRRHHDDSNETTTDDEEKTDIVQCGQNSIPEDDDGAAGPGDDEEGDVDVPRLDDEVGVE